MIFYTKIFSEVSYLASNSSLMNLYMLVFGEQRFYVYMCHGIKFKLKNASAQGPLVLIVLFTIVTELYFNTVVIFYS